MSASTCSRIASARLFAGFVQATLFQMVLALWLYAGVGVPAAHAQSVDTLTCNLSGPTSATPNTLTCGGPNMSCTPPSATFSAWRCTRVGDVSASFVTCLNNFGRAICAAVWRTEDGYALQCRPIPAADPSAAFPTDGDAQCDWYAVSALTLSPSALNFGGQAVGTPSSARLALLTNTGTKPVPISSIAINSAANGAYTQTNDCPETLAPQASCTIVLTFSPTDAGPIDGNFLNVNYKAFPEQLDQVNASYLLQGTGTAVVVGSPQLSVSPSPVVFGDKFYGTSSAPKQVTVTNSGSVPVNISGVSVPSAAGAAQPDVFDYALDSNTCAGALAPGASCVATVSFIPTAVGPRIGLLRIQSDVAGGVTEISLAGGGSTSVGGWGPFDRVNLGTTLTSTVQSGCGDNPVRDGPRSASDKCTIVGKDVCVASPELCFGVNAVGGGRDGQLSTKADEPSERSPCEDTDGANAPVNQPETAIAMEQGSSYGIVGVNAAVSASVQVGDPINTATGSKSHLQTDYYVDSAFPLSLARTYNSTPGSAVTLNAGAGWRTNWDRLITVSSNGLVATMVDGDGSEITFNKQATGSWVASSIELGTLEQDASGWRYRSSNGSERIYSLEGRLRSASTFDGKIYALTYFTSGPSNGLLESVSNPFGRTLNFVYDAKRHLHKLIDPAGGETVYGYDSKNRLITVTFPDSRTRSYKYEHPTFAFALTSIIEPDGTVGAKFEYDALGRATTSELGGGVGRVSVAYNADGTTTTTDASATRTRSYSDIAGLRVGNGITTSCSGCPTQNNSVQYNAQGLVTQSISPAGLVSAFTYDTRGNLLTQRTAVGTAFERLTTTTWHATRNIPLSVNAEGLTTTYTYDANYRVTQVAVSAGGPARITTYTYNAAGLLAQVDGPRTDVNDITTYTYDSFGQLLTTTNPAMHVTRVLERDGHGRVKRIEYPSGQVRETTYDPVGRVLTTTFSARTTTYTYDVRGNLATVTDPDGLITTYLYDAANRVIGQNQSNGEKMRYTLDDQGRQTKVDTFDAAGVLASRSQTEYDGLGRLQRSINATGQATTYTYDAAGNVTQTTDALGNIVQMSYDTLNRPILVKDALGKTTATAYDAQGRVAAITDPNNSTTTYTYNAFGESIATLSPDAGNTATQRDNAGLVKVVTDARGKTATYTHDALGRTTAVAYNDGQGVTRSYDVAANGVGLLASITDSSGTTSYTYDARGRTASRSVSINGGGINGAVASVSKTVSYSRDALGRVSSMTYPSGKVLGITYQNERIAALTLDGQPLISGVQYFPFGAAESWSLHFGGTDASGNPIVLPNNLASAYIREIDTNKRNTGFTLSQSQRKLTYDAGGRITKIEDFLNGSSSSAKSQNFTYDPVGRLTSFNGFTSAAAAESQSFTYDANGNRLSSVLNGANNTYLYQIGTNKLTGVTGTNASVAAYNRSNSLDAMGSLTASVVSEGTRSFTYDARARLTQAVGPMSAGGGVSASVTTTYKLNANGQRVFKSNSLDSKFFIYSDSGNLLGEYDKSGNVILEYLWLGDMLVAVVGKLNQPDPVVTTTTTSTLPQPITTVASNITTFNDNNGAIIRVGERGNKDWELQLGDSSSNSNTNKQGQINWVAGKTYFFEVSYTGTGGGTMKISDTNNGGGNNFTAAIADNSNANAQVLKTGNALRFKIKQAAGLGSAKMTAQINSVDGVAINSTLETSVGSGGNNLAEEKVLVLHYPSLANGFTATGSFTISFQGNLPSPSDALQLSIHAGTANPTNTSTTTTTPQPQNVGVAYVFNDQLGTPREIVEKRTGKALWKWDSLPFGETQPNENPSLGTATSGTGTGTSSGQGKFTFNLRFPGQYYDAETGLHQNWHRDYDPRLGRYVQVDPLGLGGGANPYVYVGSIPTMLLDPTGLLAIVSCERCGSAGGLTCSVSEDGSAPDAKGGFSFTAPGATASTTPNQVYGVDGPLPPNVNFDLVKASSSHYTINTPGYKDGTVIVGNTKRERVQGHSNELIKVSNGCLIPNDTAVKTSKDINQSILAVISRNEKYGGTQLRILERPASTCN
jgi:RHS repeat-associated protein